MADDKIDTVIVIGDGKLVRSPESKAWWDAVSKAAENAPVLIYERPGPPPIGELLKAIQVEDLPVLEGEPAPRSDEGFLLHEGEICRAGPGGLSPLTLEQAANLLDQFWRKIDELEDELETAWEESMGDDL